MDLRKQYQRLFEGKARSNDKKLLKEEAIKIDGKEVDLTSFVISGVDKSQGPDDGSPDAYAEEASFVDGSPLSDDQLDTLNDEYTDAVIEFAIDNWHNL